MYDSPDILQQYRSECEEELRASIFGHPGASPRPVIPWVRLPLFQRESLRLIAIDVLSEMPLLKHSQRGLQQQGR